MPYIKEEYRIQFDVPIIRLQQAMYDIADEDEVFGGIMNYVITKLLRPSELSYNRIMVVLGTLEAVKLEFYRRAAAPYEDTKRKENGDVYFEEARQ